MQSVSLFDSLSNCLEKIKFIMYKLITYIKTLALLVLVGVLPAVHGAGQGPPLFPVHRTPDFFNGKDLSGWSGNDGYWSVEDGAIVGHADKDVPKNEFIWSNVEVGDFHLSVDVKLTADNRNAGIQFRSKPVNDHGQALGYQADVGLGVWGKLYHEHGRGKLDWNDRAKAVIKQGDWNRYEILAVGDRIWTSINGTLCVALKDPIGERLGKIAFQIHSGNPQTVFYRNPVLTHNPKVVLVGMNEAELNKQLVSPLDQSE